MATEIDGRVLAEFVHGDLSHLKRLESVPQEVLGECRAELPQLRVSRESVTKVIAGLRAGKFSEAQVQRWASLVRRGYFPRSASGPIVPVEIEIDEKHETMIIECVSRLDELGDRIDGEIEDNELDEMVMSLRAC